MCNKNLKEFFSKNSQKFIWFGVFVLTIFLLLLLALATQTARSSNKAIDTQGKAATSVKENQTNDATAIVMTTTEESTKSLLKNNEDSETAKLTDLSDKTEKTNLVESTNKEQNTQSLETVDEVEKSNSAAMTAVKSSLGVEETVSDGLSGSSFKVIWDNSNLPESGSPVSYTATVHYGYLDRNGLYHNDSLPANRQIDAKRDITGGSSIDGDGKVVVNWQCSQFNLANYNQAIIYEDANYSYCSSCIGGLPDSTEAKPLTKFSCAAKRNEDETNSYNWHYANELQWFDRDDMDVYGAAKNIDIYMVYKPNDGESSAYYFTTDNPQKFDYKHIHWCAYSNGSYEVLTAPWTPTFPRQAVGSEASAISFTLTYYTSKPVVHNYEDYKFDTIKIGLTTGIKKLKAYYNTDEAQFHWYFSTDSSGSSWTEFTQSDIYIEYQKYSVKTIDSIDKNIKINMFDYDTWRKPTWDSGNSKYNLGNFEYGINGFSDFKFSEQSLARYEWNTWAGSRDFNICSGLVKNKLNNGYPVLNMFGSDSYHKSNSDLSYLFSDNIPEANYYKDNYENINHLFSQEVYDKTGAFSFDSSNNSIKLDKTNHKFASLPTEPGGAKFMPLNDQAYSKENNNDRNQNFLFGMTIDMNFMQPVDGMKKWKDKPSTEMVYSFTGDDDLFVFIDDVLVLEEGGLHNAITGNIDFANGVVNRPRAWNIDGDVYNNLSLYEMFVAAGKAGSESDWEPVIEKDGHIYKRFADNSVHTMKMVYLERGAGLSNCKMSFNFEPVPNFQVGKQVNQEDPDLVINDDASFLYNIQKLNFATSKYEPYIGKYDVYTGQVGRWQDLVAKDLTTSDGVITLKRNQVAFITGLNVGDQLRVCESDNAITDPKRVWDIKSNGADVSQFKEIDWGGKTWWGVEDIEVTEVSGSDYNNGYREDAIYKLKVKKIDLRSDGKGDKNTPVKISLNGKEYLGNYQLDNGETVLDYSSNPEAENYRATTIDEDETIIIPKVGAGTPVSILTDDTVIEENDLYFRYNPSYNLENEVKPDDNKYLLNGDIKYDQTSDADERYSQVVLYIDDDEPVPPTSLIIPELPEWLLLILGIALTALITYLVIKVRKML